MKILLRLIREITDKHDFSEPGESEESQSLQNDFSDMLFSATELAHSRASKVLSIRSEKHASRQQRI